ncbi:S66 peptidase family protein [Clostridium algidicarnis]|uniref:S66 peptidase family protein n=1 Tax=Clostridium algidicarnis TaxID=37659 RepID=UPI001C0E20F1|nr:LD-carboxypeptidase [Clostridium algidicarnis]MBU3196894.1 LD-carboxypeptidase [Clostridium algidicarnis]MBU3210208.1 LD-carboxypeptidase [Clostridium algidicarnis]MBU3227963.1 LD-carboxypeptidase [Clostridium algidicarnis]MBU3251713.1 LD-carboxypeptidase [Clostridium algidicarnis]
MLSNKLEFGDTISVIAPAGFEENSIIDEKINIISSLGFNIKKSVHLYDKYGYLAGNDMDRSKDLMDAFKDPSVKAIICFRGGYGSSRILPYLNFETIKENPKIFMGFSDITVLLNSIYEKSSLITYHGPMVNSDMMNIYNLKNFVNTLMKNNDILNISNPKNDKLNFYGSNSIEGYLVGGNLSIICSTLGTPYEIDTKDKILFIEEINEEPYKIDRMLTQLKLANKLDCCKGFILGKFTNCNTSNTRSFSLTQVLRDNLLSFNKPTVINISSGHDNNNLILPIGAKYKIDVKKENLGIIEEFLI